MQQLPLHAFWTIVHTAVGKTALEAQPQATRKYSNTMYR